MITFDSLTLKAWIEENRTFLTGARIQKIQQPTRKDFVLTIRSNGETRKLYININPQFHHLCFMNKENEAKRLIVTTEMPIQNIAEAVGIPDYSYFIKVFKSATGNTPTHYRKNQ